MSETLLRYVLEKLVSFFRFVRDHIEIRPACLANHLVLGYPACSSHQLSFLPILSQVPRANVTLHGRLAYKLTEGPSPNPRWLVTFDDQNHKDEELYEKAFGRTIRSVADEDDKLKSGALSNNRRVRGSSHGRKPTDSSNNRNGSNHKGSATSSEDAETEDDKQPSKKKSISNKSVSFSEEGGSVVGSDESSGMLTNDKVSAREQRSLRRQAKIEEEAVILPPPVPSNGANRKRRLPSKHSSLKKRKSDGDEEVVKVKLKTGTLYLYRGLNRRAEFVRRV